VINVPLPDTSAELSVASQVGRTRKVWRPGWWKDAEKAVRTACGRSPPWPSSEPRCFAGKDVKSAVPAFTTHW